MEEDKQSISETEDISKAYETYFNRKIGDKLNTIFKKNNTMALIIRFVGVLVIVAGVFLWSNITIGINKVDTPALIIILLISCFIAFIFFTIAEVIQILHDIRFRLWMK